MPREADFYTPGEAARLLGLTEFAVLGLLTSGQLEGYQDEQARWFIPAAAVEEAVRRISGADPRVDPSTEETIVMEAVIPSPQGSEGATTQSEAESREARGFVYKERGGMTDTNHVVCCGCEHRIREHEPDLVLVHDTTGDLRFYHTYCREAVREVLKEHPPKTWTLHYRHVWAEAN